ncbi:MAG TPA: hypothetical protein VNR66_03465 [Solirubrobacteraceae bacterium]|nr:hypothetical protein [Solirubrobacteraceae bacterium]
MPFHDLHLPGGRTFAALALTGALAVGVSACGSSSSASSSAVAGTAVSTSSSRYTARLAYAKCMRAHGVNVPDPSPNGGPAGGGGGGGGAFRTLRNSPNFQAASQACASLRAKAFAFANTSPAQRAQFQQELVKFATCMRSHNIDIPDPSITGGGGFGILRQIPSSERNSPAFQTALKACSSILPRFGRGGAGGGAPGA